jgi:hypothetical protein
MDLSAFFQSLLSTQTPALPDLGAMRVARYVSWAIVLAGIVMCAGRRWPRRIQRGLAAVLFVWTLIPGPVSPAFWLGLAFQMPSMMSTVLLSVVVVSILKTGSFKPADPAIIPALQWASLGGVLLGWLLLLDTFALLPLSLYAIGFSPAMLGLIALLTSLPVMVLGLRHGARIVTFLLWTVLLLHVLLRLPTGNLWDALLDPWLWVALQLGWLVRGVQRLNAVRREAPATRA